MDYMYGELNDLVKNINYEGKNTTTANTTVDNIERTIKVDVNLEGIDYTTAVTDTAKMNQDTSTRTYSVDVLKVPGKLNFTTNEEVVGSKSYDGEKTVNVDLRPIAVASKDNPNFTVDSVKQIFREEDTGNLFYVVREGIPPMTFTVQNVVGNNTEIPDEEILNSLTAEWEVSSVISTASGFKLYCNKDYTIIQPDESEYEIDAFRLGSSNATGSLTLTFIHAISGITVNASIYCSPTGRYDIDTDLYINGVAVGVGDSFEEFTIEFEEPTTEVTFENIRTGTNAGRIWIDKITTPSGSDRYVPVEISTGSGGGLTKEEIQEAIADGSIETSNIVHLDTDYMPDINEQHLEIEITDEQYNSIRNNPNTVIELYDDNYPRTLYFYRVSDKFETISTDEGEDLYVIYTGFRNNIPYLSIDWHSVKGAITFYKYNITDNAFTVTANEFATAKDNENVLLRLRMYINNDYTYYTLNKSAHDANSVTFSSDKYVARFYYNGENYVGEVREVSSGGGTQLYKHLIKDKNYDYVYLTFISTSSDSIDFSVVTDERAFWRQLYLTNGFAVKREYTGQTLVPIYDEFYSESSDGYRIAYLFRESNNNTVVAFHDIELDFNYLIDVVEPL